MTEIMTISDVAARLQVGRQNVYKWVKNGQLGAIKLPGGDYRVTQEEFCAFIERCRGASSKDPITDYLSGDYGTTSISQIQLTGARDPFQQGRHSAARPNDGETNG